MTEADAAPALPAPQPQEYRSEDKKSAHSQVGQTHSSSPDRKNTVLENHGYYLGRTIGSGSYAMVKVNEKLR